MKWIKTEHEGAVNSQAYADLNVTHEMYQK